MYIVLCPLHPVDYKLLPGARSWYNVAELHATSVLCSVCPCTAAGEGAVQEGGPGQFGPH